MLSLPAIGSPPAGRTPAPPRMRPRRRCQVAARDGRSDERRRSTSVSGRKNRASPRSSMGTPASEACCKQSRTSRVEQRKSSPTSAASKPEPISAPARSTRRTSPGKSARSRISSSSSRSSMSSTKPRSSPMATSWAGSAADPAASSVAAAVGVGAGREARRGPVTNAAPRALADPSPARSCDAASSSLSFAMMTASSPRVRRSVSTTRAAGVSGSNSRTTKTRGNSSQPGLSTMRSRYAQVASSAASKESNTRA